VPAGGTTDYTNATRIDFPIDGTCSHQSQRALRILQRSIGTRDPAIAR
jgi:hypothetical protein